jgi:hypothetical protein
MIVPPSGAIEVRTVGRQEHEFGACALDGIAHTGCFVCGQVVHNDNVPDLKGRQQHLLDICQEDITVRCSVVDKGGGHACEARRAGERRCFPMAVRHACSTTLAANCASAQACHFGRQPGLVYEDQLFRIEIELAIKPDSPALQDIRSILLQCMCGLFLNVHPRRRSQAPSALRLMPTCRSADRRSSIISTTNASYASKLEDLRQPCGRDVGSPSLALAIQRIAVEIPTPNRAAACRADMPAADAFNTRNRRSSLSARAIIHLLAVDVEPASPRRVTSQSIHQSQHLL